MPQIRTMEDVRRVRPLVPGEAVPYAGAALTALRGELAGTGAAVLGFVGAPFTLATYCVEGGTTSSYLNIKQMAWAEPAILHALLERLTDGVIEYVRFQADAGAQVVQIFDSWGCNLHPSDWDVFSAPYITRIVREVKATHPTLPLILYANGSGGMLERMGATGVDCVSVDQSVDIADARVRLGKDKAVQGNLDPAWLFGSADSIRQRVDDTVAKAGGHKHVLNLGHGVMPSTPEAGVAAFFEAARTAHERARK
jgi:uroporphyrinogen decarboxylase